jgi:hypothetical protein
LDKAFPKIFICVALSLVLFGEPAGAQETGCAFDDSTLSYRGTAQEQARCLLRPVLTGGRLSTPLKKLPAPLHKIIGRPTEIDAAGLGCYLTERGIDAADLGGSLSAPVSRANLKSADAPAARYFVIHDVSTPNYLDAPFPPDINEASWKWNDLGRRWMKTKVTHVYVSRTGASITAVDFGSELPEPHHGTKFARDRLRNLGKGLYLHVELIQPRRSDPRGAANNDRIAPLPGFTDAQLARLALVYTAASVRAGQWLIPAYHAAVDAGIPDAHDDPQNFDLARWAHHLAALLKSISQTPEPAPRTK